MAGTLYLLAHAPFETTRFLVREIEGGRTYLFDVSASEQQGKTHPVQIYASIDENPASAQADAHPRDGRQTRSYSYVALTRFAAQQLYAPTRLLKTLPGVNRVPLTTDPIPLVRGGAVTATPLISWRAGGLYITAVKLINHTKQAQVLDPRNLRGQWLTANFQHARLLPAGDEADTTAVYLISARPFEASL